MLILQQWRWVPSLEALACRVPRAACRAGRELPGEPRGSWFAVCPNLPARHAARGTRHPSASRPGGSSVEAELLRAAREGDGAALERLLAPYQRSLHALCLGMLGRREDAEDAVQETFLRALRALPGFRGDAAVRTWLFRIAINLCLEWKRALRATEPLDESLDTPHPQALSPEATALRHLRLIEALRALLPRHRAVILLKELEGWSVAEIAVALGWNEHRVRNELSRARRALADWREREEREEEAR